VGAFELATILLVAAVALAGVGIVLFVGALGLMVTFRRRTAAPTAPTTGREAPVMRSPRSTPTPGSPERTSGAARRPGVPVPPVSVSSGKNSYFDDDGPSTGTATVQLEGNRMRAAGDGDHDEHTELFSMADVEAELIDGGVMEDYSNPGARVPRAAPKR
jgi:hypothetical protein